MKKFISIILAVIMSVSVLTANVMPCYAVWIGSIEEADKDIVIKVTVNGIDSIHGEYENLTGEDKDNGYYAVIDFVYTGDKTVLYWELKDLVEGVDYIILEDNGTSIKVAIIKDGIDDIWANVVTTDPEEESTTGNKKPNKDRTSPDTGAGLMTAAVSAGAGVALLAAIKKRKQVLINGSKVTSWSL